MHPLAAQIVKSLTPKFVKSAILGQISNYPEMYGGLANTLSNVSVTPRNAETISAFATCIRVKAETAAVIETGLHRIEGDKTYRERENPLDYLLSVKPDEIMNAYDYWYTSQVNEDTWGNAYSYIDRTIAGRPGAIILWNPWEVVVDQLQSDRSIWYVKQGEKPKPQRDVLHFKQNSRDGLVGRSIVSIGKETLGLAKKQEQYAAKVFGEKPQAVFEDGANLSAEQALKIAEGFKDHVKRGITPMVWGGLKYKPILIPPGDAQYIESIQSTKADVYGMFRIPPFKMQTYSRESGATYANVEQQNIAFVSDVVMPSVRSKEVECNTKLLSRKDHGKYKVEFDISELLKADLKTEKEYIESMLTRGVISRNEARKMRRMNPIDPKIDPNGDRNFIQAGFVPADRIDDFINNAKPETPKSLKLNGNHVAEN